MDRLNRLTTNDGGDRLLEVFAHHLAGGLTNRTFDDLARGIDALIGLDALTTVLWAAQSDPDNWEDLFVSQGYSESSRELLKRIVVLYGGAAVDAYYRSPLGALAGEDWDRIDPEVFWDSTAEQHLIEVSIRKNNRESMTVRGNAGSMIRWTRIMLETVEKIGSREAFAPRDVERLMAVLDKVRELLASPPSDTSRGADALSEPPPKQLP